MPLAVTALVRKPDYINFDSLILSQTKMSERKFPPPPYYSSLDLDMMSAKELRESLEVLWDWVDRAEMAPESIAPSDDEISDVRQLMGTIIAERVERHSDESGRTPE